MYCHNFKVAKSKLAKNREVLSTFLGARCQLHPYFIWNNNALNSKCSKINNMYSCH